MDGRWETAPAAATDCPPPPYTSHLPPHTCPVSTRVEVTRAGVSLGTALAIAISWSVNKSIIWAIIHGILSWLYVLYYALTR